MSEGLVDIGREPRPSTPVVPGLSFARPPSAGGLIRVFRPFHVVSGLSGGGVTTRIVRAGLRHNYPLLDTFATRHHVALQQSLLQCNIGP
jgi:hypothetical protein